MDKMNGSMDVLSAMQLTSDTEGFDAECKLLLHSREVLAVILQGTVEEYEGYGLEEIMDFIEADSVEERREVSSGRTNSRIRGESAEFAQLNEKASFFDVLFRARNPKLSAPNLQVNLPSWIRLGNTSIFQEMRSCGRREKACSVLGSAFWKREGKKAEKKEFMP